MRNAYTIDENGFEVKVPHSELLTEHDYEPMIEADYQLRLEVAKAKGQDPSTIKKRTPEQIFNSINRTDSRKHFAFYKTKVSSPNGNEYEIKMVQPVASLEGDMDIPLDMDNLGEHSADYSSVNEINDWISLEAIKQDLIHGGLESERVELLIRCDVTKDKKKKDIAIELNIDSQSLTMRLQRTRGASKKILEPLGYHYSTAKEKQEVEK